jgi:hypothetical protein
VDDGKRQHEEILGLGMWCATGKDKLHLDV